MIKLLITIELKRNSFELLLIIAIKRLIDITLRKHTSRIRPFIYSAYLYICDKLNSKELQVIGYKKARLIEAVNKEYSTKSLNQQISGVQRISSS